jgi:hypothetical protein
MASKARENVGVLRRRRKEKELVRLSLRASSLGLCPNVPSNSSERKQETHEEAKMLNRNYTHVTREHQFLAEGVWGKYEDKKMICLAQTHAEETK